MKNYLQLKFENFLDSLNFKLTQLSSLFNDVEYNNRNQLELSSKSFVKRKKANTQFALFLTLTLSLFGFVQNATSQTTLAAGDLAIIGFNTNTTPDDMVLLVLKDLTAGTVFYVNDNEVLTLGGTSFAELNEAEASFTVKAGQTIAKGTVLVLPWNGLLTSTTAYDWNVTAGAGLGNGEEIYVYTASSITATTPTAFIYGVTQGANTGLRPNGLTDGVTWIDHGTLRAYRYNITGATYSGTEAQLLAAIGNTANYTGAATYTFASSDWSFTIGSAANPTVTLSVSTNSGTEAGATAITITATASSAVSGNQTVALAITGTGITAGDYMLSNTTITILNGQTTGSVTFTVTDDALVESTETATLTISSPSAGITLGTTTTQNIAITDNDVAPNPTVSISVSANAGSEAGTTAITVTATASSAVSTDQTVALGVSGTNITTGDYTLSNSTITILNGQTTGSVTFTVTDDALFESTETATLTISSPSAGITLGTTTTQNIAITDNDSALTIDLSTYVRVGRYDLPEPTRTTAPTNNLLCQEASAVAYNWDTDTLFITADGSTSVTQVSKTGVLIDTMTMALGGSPQGTDFYDTEGLTYIGGGQFVMSEERDRQLVKFTYAAGTTLTRANTQTVKIGTFVPNTGTEGLCYDPITGGFICLKEIDPIGIFQTNVDFAAGTATNGSPTTVNSVNLFDPALLGFIDVADVFVLANIPTQSTSPNLLVLSQENAQVVNIDRNGNIASTLTIVTDPGNPLNVASQQHEGITMDNNGNIYIVSENGGGDINHPQLWVYAPSATPNQAPTAIALTNTVPSIIENAITTPAVRVADILLTDDGLGTNTYSLSGADANNFQITASSLFIKPGTVLDFETKSTYNVTVNVDDTTVGATPDASVNFVLSVTDLVNETPQLPNVTISEVAPWGSGNSPALADWFEVTNNGTTALNISGWKVDDSSNSFAASLALTGITSIAAGESVIFLESSASNPAATVIANFKSLWFGANPPASLQVGTYQGSGIGLSTGGDAVNLYDASGVLQANVIFGASPTVLFKTFNNAVGLNNTTISLLSEVGVNDAFVAVNDVAEIGSPGSVGRLFISEVAPWSSGNSPVGADWFEVTNTKAVAVDITGWKVDDSSQSPAAAVALNGITSINPGESVIFIETNDLPGKTTAFLNNWFGTNPTGSLRIGNYTGSGIGLGTGGDQVNLYNTTSSTPQTSVLFGSSPAAAPYTTFDNKAGVNSLVTAITQFSAVSVNGAFIAANSTNEVGSPGTIITAPCPTITATATPALSTVCFGATTTVTVTATGGTLPYTVTGSPLTVGGGTFTYTITDAKGCTATATTTVTSLPAATVNLSVTTNTASETAGTIVTITATASAPVCVNETISLGVSGTGITGADYTLSNATITIPSGSTTGSVTFTVVSDNAVEPLETATLTISNPSSGIVLGTTTTQDIAISDFVFTLQVLHASDFEGAVEAVQDAPRFAAIVDQLEESYVNTIKLSSGDNYIPGPFLSSGGDPTLAPVYKTAYENFYNTTFTSPPVNLAVSIGRADISIMNFIGIEASALGNHEFDLGTNEIRTMIAGANNTGATTTTWYGAQFPYLSSNLNFSGDSNLASISTTNRLRLNTSFMSSPTETPAAISAKTKLAPSTIIMKGGQKIGIVGCTTQILASISSPGATTVIGGGANDMNILAGIVQPTVDALIADGCNKIILLSHLQQIAFEQDLATKLTGVDIIIAAGSNTLLADANDRLRAGDVAAGTYPFLATDLAGRTVPVVNTDGNYKYVGRLVVDFDSDGNLLPASINDAISGVYATDQQGLNDVWGANVGNAFLPGTRGYQVQLLCNAIGNVINSKDGNLFGKTSVFLEGRRNFVRTEETNLGNITSEANLWLAKFYDPTTVISIKNGGGIRSAIGNVIAVGDNVTLVPPIANPGAGKQSGDISQLDIENSLRFNNQLSLMTLTASGLRAILEHAVNATTATATPGQFAQVAGVRYSYNLSNASGSKILNAVITDAAGNVIDTLVVNGVTVGNLSRTFRVVTLNFLAGNGDGYPFVASSVPGSRLDLNTVPEQGPAMASFANSGSEQDAFAEYMKNQFSTTPYGIADTALVNDCRIQRVPARADNVLPPNAGTNGTLSICTGTTVTTAQLFAALGGTPQTGGIWSPALAGAGVYTYTVTSPSCAGSASATVTVTETPQPLWYLDADGDGYYTGVAVPSCTSPGAGYTTTVTGGGDCTDTGSVNGVPANLINPGRPEVCYNNVDDNCNTTLSEGCAPVVVNMTATTATLTTFSNAVAANLYSFSPYTNLKYRFIITKIQTGQANEVQEVTLPTRYVTIPGPMRSYTATYTISAAAVINDEVLAYQGNTMTVTPPAVPAITLSTGSCGATLTGLNGTISANAGLNATGYIFRIRKAAGTDPVTGPFFTSPSTGRFISANTFTGLPLEYNGAYKVSVAYTYLDPADNSTQTTTFGAECDLFTLPIPKINLVAPTCGTIEAPATVSSMTATVASGSAVGATGYQFQIRVTGGATYFATAILPTRYTQLSSFGTTLSFNTNYSISAQYYTLINGVSTPSGYGAECHITTPAFPTTQLVQTQCGNDYTLAQQLNIIPYQFFPRYRVRLVQPDPENTEDVLVVATKIVNYSYFKLSDFPAAQVGQTYFVEVAIEINGVFGDYGNSCEINVVAPEILRSVAPKFKATAYPNPFADNFMLDVKTESQSVVNVKVYDMVGRLIEQREVRTNDLETTAIGNNYPSGVYNVVVGQEDNLETVRVVKR